MSGATRTKRRYKRIYTSSPARARVYAEAACFLTAVVHVLLTRAKDPRSTVPVVFRSSWLLLLLAGADRFSSEVLARVVQVAYAYHVLDRNRFMNLVFREGDVPCTLSSLGVTLVLAGATSWAWIGWDSKERFYFEDPPRALLAFGVSPAPWNPMRRGEGIGEEFAAMLLLLRLVLSVSVAAAEAEWFFRSLVLDLQLPGLPLNRTLVSLALSVLQCDNLQGGVVLALVAQLLQQMVGMWSCLLLHALVNAAVGLSAFFTGRWELW